MIINRATLGFSSILAKQSDAQKKIYLDLLAINIKEKREMCYLTIKMLSSLLKSYKSGEEVIKYLEKEHGLHNALFEEF